MHISIIIPCYNEELVILETYKKLTDEIKKLNEKYELIFINDGSNDSTLSILKEIATKDNLVKIINLSRNFGHQNAVTAGINNCNGDIAVIIDADLQDPPSAIPLMIEKMQSESANVVYGVRKDREGETWIKLLTAKIFYRLLNKLSDVSFPLDTGDFRIIDRSVINQFNSLKEKNKYIRGLISWMGYKQIPFYYSRQARFAGETKYPFKKMLKLALTSIFYFSKKPLDIAISLGIISVSIGLIYVLWVFISIIFSLGHVVTGWTSTIVIIVFFGGIQLLTTGILGKYIGNLFDEAKNRPEYIIENKINF
ncbi:MAG: glycosyltransferase family 2 protein [Marinilabiliaceae bacterium]|nr:glycosyltransferase family 2 protein [Marinilabiliaceae bacterium]